MSCRVVGDLKGSLMSMEGKDSKGEVGRASYVSELGP
jgi:hypothetical protein